MAHLKQEALDHLFAPACIVDEKLCLTYFNPSMSTLLQLPPRKIKGAAIGDLIALKAGFWESKLKVCQEKGLSISEEIDFTLNGSSFTFVFRMVKVSDQEFVIFSNDLSVEKSLHSKYREQVNLLRESHQQVVQADKVRVIGELTAGISHEINNPLTVASGNAELLGFALDNENLEEQREIIENCVGNIDEALERIQNIITGMKGFLHQGKEDKKEYIDLKNVIENSLNLTQGTLEGRGISVTTKMEADSPVVLGNKTRLEQILINLLQNATDSLKGIDKPKIEIKCTRDFKKHFFYLEVRDNGHGVPENIKAKIFENFFTTKDMGEGTGLGLSLCRKIAEDHQGDLKLIETKEGACFQLSLPVIEVSSFASNDEIFSKLNAVNGKKILVVDNDVTILNLCQKIMEPTNFIFIGSTGGEEALDVFDKYDVDAVVTDLNMPGLSGKEFVTKLREVSKGVPVFYLSDSSGVEQYQKDRGELNLAGMIVKPFKAEDLVNPLTKELLK